MKNSKKVLFGTLILSISVLTVTGCGNKAETKMEINSETKTETNAEANVETKEETKTEANVETNQAADSETVTAEKSESKESVKKTDNAETGEETDSSKSAPSAVSYSTDDWKSLEFSLNGKVYTFPLSYADFEADGYTMDDSLLNEELKSKQYTMTSARAKNAAGEQIRISFKNTTEQTVAIKDASVRTVVLSSGSYDNENTTFGLCNGIQNGDSVETVIALMGEEPQDRHDGSSITSLTYKFESQDTVMKSSIKFSFNETGLYEIELTNMDF